MLKQQFSPYFYPQIFNLFRQFFVTLFLFIPALSFAQGGAVTLTGTLEVSTGETFPFKVVLTEQEGKVKGYSLTYKEPDDTKALITGKLDKQARTLSFKETEIVYSHNFHTRAFMCLIDARLNYVYAGNRYVLKGSITSKEADKTSCTDGVLTFANEDELKNLFSYHDTFDTVISMKRKVIKPAEETDKSKTVKEELPPAMDQVTAGVAKAYEWHSDTVVIAVWDGGDIDGDRITLQYNGKNCLENYMLQRAKKEIRIPVSTSGTDIITIIAENEGAAPPNTANLLLTDGAKKYSILAYNKKGDQAIVRIKRVP